MWHCLSPVRPSYLFVMLHASRVKEGHHFCINTDLNVWRPESMYCISLYSPLCFSVTGGPCVLVEWSESSREGFCTHHIGQFREQRRLAVRPQQTCNHWWFGEQKFDLTFFSIAIKVVLLVIPPSALCFKLANSDLTEASTLRACLVFENKLLHFLSKWTYLKHKNPSSLARHWSWGGVLWEVGN